ncbi:MAG: DUF4010 domain-containing protein, partial [Anaerolineales bacterium]|nr:DUF4010 domain-containing protein [Anaerolineales bacterium]
LPYIWPAMAAMGASGSVYALYLFFSQSAIDEEELKLSNPFELGPAIKFGLIFALVLLLSKAAEVYIGDRGLYLTSFLAGLADVDAITLSIADLTKAGHSVALITGKRAIILATLSNTASKGVLVFSLGSRKLRKFIWPAMIIMLVVGLSFVLVL